MEHRDHAAGTREDCPACRELAYEPGWYKVMRDERVVEIDRTLVEVPEADDVDIDVVIAEQPHEPARRRR